MNVIKVWSEGNPSDAGATWVAELGGRRATGRHAEEAVRTLINTLETSPKGFKWNPPAE